MSKKTEAALNEDLRAFVEDHRDGWSHDEWLALLGSIQSRGLGGASEEEIGLALERERVRFELAIREIPGLGPKRRDALAEQFGTWWNLRHASTEDIAAIPTIHAGLAEKVVEALR